MGERSQIARCSDRSFLWNAWIDLGIDQLDQCFNHFETDARIATCQTVDFQYHQQSNRRFTHHFARSGGMGENNGALQLLELLIRDMGICQQAEAGIDAVNGTSLSDDILDCFSCCGNSIQTAGVETQLNRLAVDTAEL